MRAADIGEAGHPRLPLRPLGDPVLVTPTTDLPAADSTPDCHAGGDSHTDGGSETDSDSHTGGDRDHDTAHRPTPESPARSAPAAGSSELTGSSDLTGSSELAGSSELTGSSDLAAVRAAVRSDPASVFLALDFDGTLAPLVADPASAQLLPGMATVLSALGSAGARVALVTGRAPEAVLDLSGLRGRPGLGDLQIAGLYGLQILDMASGEVETTVDDATLAQVQAVREALPGLLTDAPEGVQIEDKDIALVVHTRPAEHPQQALDDLAPAVSALAAEHGLEFEPGRFAAEIRPGGSDKGRALLRLVEGGAGGAIRAVLYAGDDTGDLSALRAVPALRARGLAAVAIAVAQPGTDPAVLDAADVVVAGPPGMLDLLRSLLD